jgi:hypothetical protein
VTLTGTTINGGALKTDSTGNILGYGTVNAVTTNNGIVNANVAGQTLSLNGNITGTGTLEVTNGATLVIGTNTGGSVQGALSITGSNSKLNLTNNHLTLSYAPGTQAAADAAIRQYLINGRNGGTWNGSTGIVTTGSTGAGVDSGYGIGYADGADGVVKVSLANPLGLSTGQIEIKYTLLGDANLDGLVSGDDFTIMATHLGPGPSNATWDEGDFTYDGLVTGDDFTDLVKNLGKVASSADIVQLPASDYAAIDAFAAANGLMEDVPEPGMLGLGAMALGGALMRRRKIAKVLPNS